MKYVNKKDYVIYNPYDNHTVADYYIGIIADSLKLIDATITYENVLHKKDNRGIVVVTAGDACKAKKCGYNPIILWVQGVAPEESFMNHSSTLRMKVLSAIEKRGILASDFLILVSQAMYCHYKKKYQIPDKNYYIAPCFNDEIYRDSFFTKDKYTNNKFVYAGGLQTWQCFDETLKIYKKIEQRVPNAELIILTKQIEKARTKAIENEINHYEVKYVEPSMMQEALSECKFGFSIRENTIVNNVSTPTKLSTYIANGVFPIYTNAISDFSSIASNSNYCYCINDDESIMRICEACENAIEPEKVLQDFTKVFGNYYSRNYHKTMLSRAFSVLSNEDC